MARNSHFARAFTLIELIVVLAIIAILMNRFISNLPASFPVAGGEVRLRGALIEIDERTGRAVRITRVDEPGLSVTASSEAEPKIDIEQTPSPEQT